MNMKIFDSDGKERTWIWVVEKYNLPHIEGAPRDKDHWEVVELHEAIGPSSMTARVLLEDGSPALGVGVAFRWPDGFVIQDTDANGQTGFGMGGGAYYRPDRGETGPHVVDIPGISDIVIGLGMIGKTNHAHLEPTFQFVKAEESPEEPPEDGWKEQYQVLLMEYNLLVDGLKEIRQVAEEHIPS